MSPFNRAFSATGAAHLRALPGHLDPGQASVPRDAVNGAAQIASGRTYLTFFTATRREVLTRMAVVTANAAAGVTTARMGVYRVEPDGTLTLIGATPNDTTVAAAAATRYVRSTEAPFTVLAGARYAAGVLLAAVTMPTLMGATPGPAGPTVYADDPVLIRQVYGTADLPSTIAPTAHAAAGGRIYLEMLP